MNNSAESRLSDIASDIRSVLHSKQELVRRELEVNVLLSQKFMASGIIKKHDFCNRREASGLRQLLSCGEIIRSVQENGIIFTWGESSEFPHDRLFDCQEITAESVLQRMMQKGWS